MSGQGERRRDVIVMEMKFFAQLGRQARPIDQQPTYVRASRPFQGNVTPAVAEVAISSGTLPR